MLGYLDELNPQQKEVVQDTESAILVLAGAGSGKTRCITYRAAYLIQEVGVKPWHLLIVTFTNKAAHELQQRLEKLLNIPMSSLWVGTFHSICLRILRTEYRHLPFNANFSIYDADEQKTLLKRLYKEHGFEIAKYPVNKVLSAIGRYKNRLQMPEDLQEQKYGIGPYQKGLINIYTRYQEALLSNQAMDFDDILLFTARLLATSEELRQKYQNIFRYVMIDEYQDTNQAQFTIIHQIAREHQRVCVVGDDDQAIYSFRGANLRNILEFEHDYQNVRKIRLEQNYRSTTSILHFANAVISKNKQRHEKKLWSEKEEGVKPRLDVYADGMEEAQMVALDIAQAQAQGKALREIAILYRTNAQSRLFENALMQNKIPYSIVGSLHFYQRKEIKDLLAYLACISNPADNQNLLRIINEPPRGIGITSINRLLGFAAQTRVSLYNTIQNAGAVSDLGKGPTRRILDFAAKLEDWRQMLPNTPVATLVKEIVEDLELIKNYQKNSDTKEIARAENLIEFVASVNEFSERFAAEYDRDPLLEDFLPFVALQTDLDKVKEDSDSVYLMTLHNAKGLEFERVYLVGLEEDILPHRMCMDSPEELEEERRLFYVGITRTKEILKLSYANSRRMYDSFGESVPSRFLRKIPKELYESHSHDADIPAEPQPYIHKKKSQISVRDSQKYYQIGQKVWHKDFGEGIVLNVDGLAEDALLTISFTKSGLKKIIGTYLEKT